MRLFVLSVGALLIGDASFAHGGGLDASGCHHDRKRGGYHCHNGNSSAPPRSRVPVYTPPTTPNYLFTTPTQHDDSVEIVQKMLTRLGYDLGNPDGRMGEMTRDAIRQFQTDRGFAVIGGISDSLIDALINALVERDE